MLKPVFGFVLLCGLLTACKEGDSRKTKSEEETPTQGLSGRFKEVQPPYQLSDTGLQKMTDTTSIPSNNIASLIPDSIKNNYFGKGSTIKYTALARLYQRDKETYYILKASAGSKVAALAMVFDKMNNFAVTYPFLLPDKDPNTSQQTTLEGKKSQLHRTSLLVLAITLHNIPEGLAVGVLFGAAAEGMPEASIAGAVALAIGIGIQNFPEGIAVAMPLRRHGVSRLKSFWFGQLSAIVEPVAGVVGAIAVIFMQPILPFALAFAAGAMIYVVVEEVIPETQRDKYTDRSVLGFIGGFLVMMILDVALG